MLQWLYTYVASICSKCFICFQTYVGNVFIWMLYMFTHMLQVFYLDVAHAFAMTFQVFFHVFLHVFHMHVSSVSSTFRRMLKMFHLIVSKVDQVLLLGTHMS
jgi:hypothetical protein